MQRVCVNCNAKIPDSKRSDALYCTTKCANRYRGKRHRRNNPDFYRAKKLREDLCIQKRYWYRIKSRCKQRNIPFDIHWSDIHIPTHCPVLGIELYTLPGRGTNQPNSASVDRIDPTGGYTKGNIRVISMRANLLKSNATISELELILKDLKWLNDLQ